MQDWKTTFNGLMVDIKLLETSETSALLKWTPDVVSVTTRWCVLSLRYLVITFSTWTRLNYNNHGVVAYSSTSFIQISVCCESVLLFLSTAIIGKLCFEIRMAWRDYRHILWSISYRVRDNICNMHQNKNQYALWLNTSERTQDRTGSYQQCVI